MTKLSAIFASLIIGAATTAFAATTDTSAMTSVTTETKKEVTVDVDNTNTVPAEECVKGKTKDGKPCQPK